MLKGLRWRLTLIYILTGVALMGLIGGGSYTLLENYFQTSTDLVLQQKMLLELERFGAPLPDDLIAASQKWCTIRGITAVPFSQVTKTAGDDLEMEQEEQNNFSEELYDAELASIFVLPLGVDGQLLFNPNQGPLFISPDQQAVQAALAEGCDWRTVSTANGAAVRLFTYRLPATMAPALLQLGRPLEDQNRVLNQLLTGIVLFGGSSVLLLGAGSWWLAGRSLLPAQKAWQQQQIFIANASHELRTPLTLLRASAEVALRRHPTPGQEQLLKDILGESDHMSLLVEDLLLISRLDTERLELAKEAINLSGMLEDLQRQISPLAENKNIQLVVKGSAVRVVADPSRVRQVLLILIDNALRHTSSGGTITITSANRSRGFYAISVEDTGEGIPPESAAHVFERFYQADKSRSEEHRGSGLGLSIAKGLVEAMGGGIELQSILGQGTKVTFWLPVVDR